MPAGSVGSPVREPVRLAVAGAGMIGRRHVAMIRACDASVLSAIVDPAPSAAALAREAGVPVFPTLEALLAADRPDGVVLATPNALHAGQGIACAAAGLPALIEKPVAHDLEAGLALLKAADRSGVPFLVGHHRRHGAIISRAAEVIRSGALGRAVAVVGTALFYKPDAYFAGAGAWRREPGGGPILLNLIHEIDNLRALAGEIVEVQALASQAARGHPVEDTAVVSFRFREGALGTFALSDAAASDRSWEHASGEDHVNFAAAHTDRDDCYLVTGTWGSLSIPTMRLQRYRSEASRSWHAALEHETLALEPVDPLAAQIAHFCAVVRGDAEPLVSLRDGVQNLRVVDAIRESVRTGRAVAVVLSDTAAEPAGISAPPG